MTDGFGIEIRNLDVVGFYIGRGKPEVYGVVYGIADGRITVRTRDHGAHVLDPQEVWWAGKADKPLRRRLGIADSFAAGALS